MPFPFPSSRSPLLRRSFILAMAAGGAVLSLRRDVLEPILPTRARDRMAAELDRAAERADICTAANAVGVGLRGEYFPQPYLRGTPRIVRVDDVIDFDRSIKGPAGEASQAVSSVRWSGWVKAPLSGKYRFHADAPGMQIMVAHKPVAGKGSLQEERVDLDAGRFYPIEIVVNQLTDSETRIRLEWTAPHGARYVVPKALLHLPTDTVVAITKA